MDKFDESNNWEPFFIGMADVQLVLGSGSPADTFFTCCCFRTETTTTREGRNATG